MDCGSQQPKVYKLLALYCSNVVTHLNCFIQDLFVVVISMHRKRPLDLVTVYLIFFDQLVFAILISVAFPLLCLPSLIQVFSLISELVVSLFKPFVLGYPYFYVLST